ncbi:HAMP domain-containing histidine kinase [Pedobacter sp. SD-b]|uniref:histidine kinase n=1 Tax=Pedobacter segetis TaxID=2793069 RepID=A0ABS1BIA6_9SPHI|nr:HAMP domain-containing sensor histidine kinase [Pedobacter segetis]MBK0382542.1 HAMP domain-containing histidine kinase [Pedobacter segetis]
MKLLTYSSRQYFWLSAIIILLSIPCFYFVVNSLFLQSTDEALKKETNLIPQYISQLKSEADLDLWKNVDHDVEITTYDPKNFVKGPFTKEFYNPETKEDERYRILETKTNVFGKYYNVSFKVSLLENDDLIQSILMVQITLLIFLLVGFQLVNRSISKRVWKPFNKILSFLKNYDLDKKTPLHQEILGIDEFNDLNMEVNSLITRTEKTYHLQKEFTENAAHELQTPVAIIKSKLDLFLQDKDLTKNQSLIVEQISYVLQKLGDLNKNLLLLTKLENQQFHFDEEIDVREQIKAVIEHLSFFADAKYQQILFNRPKQVFIKGNLSLFTQLIQNLLINAIQHSSKGTIINIQLNDDDLIFINEGAALNFSEEKLFSRFSKTIEKDQKGNGLGLAISNKIAEVHHFKLTYQYNNTKHFFNINFSSKG